jgi:hypothetical protein
MGLVSHDPETASGAPRVGQPRLRAALCDGTQNLWICLEPDTGLLARARRDSALPSCCRLLSGGSSALAASGSADAILYIDTLEHIGDDRSEASGAPS